MAYLVTGLTEPKSSDSVAGAFSFPTYLLQFLVSSQPLTFFPLLLCSCPLFLPTTMFAVVGLRCCCCSFRASHYRVGIHFLWEKFFPSNFCTISPCRLMIFIVSDLVCNCLLLRFLLSNPVGAWSAALEPGPGAPGPSSSTTASAALNRLHGTAKIRHGTPLL